MRCGGSARRARAVFTWTAGLLAVSGIWWTGCGAETDATAPRGPDAGQVYLLGTEQLEAPALGSEKSYRPTFISDTDEAAGFFLTVAVRDAESLRLLLTNHDTGETASLGRVDPPVAADKRALAARPQVFNAQVRAVFEAEGAVFWVIPEPAAAESSAARVAVVVSPRLLGSSATLELHTDRLPDGTILGAEKIELVRDFFYLAVLGDSVLWGNGLREENKAWHLVARALERETGRHVITQVHAHSGAVIVPSARDAVCTANCTGEVPVASTSVMLQTQQLEHPELLDLILLDGCINDVGVGVIVDPAVPDEELLERTAQFCEDEMITLLEEVRAQAPQARVIVTGYYQIMGPDSDLFGVESWIESQGVELTAEQQEMEGWLVETLVGKSELFHTASSEHLATAVKAINAQSTGPRQVAFADPGFGPQNAVFTPERWLWSLRSDGEMGAFFDIDLELFPEDPLFGYRVARCFEPDVLLGLVGCLFGSVGHPNPAGAQAYADAILTQLQTLDVIP